MEKFNDQPYIRSETSEPAENRPEKRNGILKSVTNTAALAAAICAGYFGGASDLHGQESGSGDSDSVIMAKNVETTSMDAYEKFKQGTTNIFELIYHDAHTVYGIEYIPHSDARGHNSLHLRYVKLDQDKHTSTILGEYSNIMEADAAISRMADLPAGVRDYQRHDINAISTEKALRDSGLTDSKVAPKGEAHKEIRDFQGYGIHVTSQVSVDKDGMVVSASDFDIK